MVWVLTTRSDIVDDSDDCDDVFVFQVNAGIELMKRDEFIRDVNLVVGATKNDYYNVLEQELHRAVRVWTEDAIHLLPDVADFAKKKREGRKYYEGVL